MTRQRNFLITYGLHNYVTYARKNGAPAFVIQGQEDKKMVRHAKDLIKGSYGNAAAIQVV